jgi:hypothetical protein
MLQSHYTMPLLLVGLCDLNINLTGFHITCGLEDPALAQL